MIFTYQGNGYVTKKVVIDQTIRGSDTINSATPPDLTTGTPLADRKVLSSPTITATVGSSNRAEVQTAVLMAENNTSQLSIKEGDIFRVTIPKANGTVITTDVTVGAVTSSTDPNGMLALKKALQDAAAAATTGSEGSEATPAGPLYGLGSFDVPSAGTLQLTYPSNGEVVGKFSITQIAAGDTS